MLVYCHFHDRPYKKLQRQVVTNYHKLSRVVTSCHRPYKKLQRQVVTDLGSWSPSANCSAVLFIFLNLVFVMTSELTKQVSWVGQSTWWLWHLDDLDLDHIVPSAFLTLTSSKPVTSKKSTSDCDQDHLVKTDLTIVTNYEMRELSQDKIDFEGKMNEVLKLRV